MAHPNLQTNGASLEDCHTNFFALTDLCGIRWRKLTSEGFTPPASNGGVYGPPGQPGSRLPSTQPWDYLNDPVLSSYWRCLSNDILCVWRRIPVSTVTSPTSATFPHPLGGGPGGSLSGSSSLNNGLNSLSGAKELWIFWYGDTAPELTDLVSPEILTGLDVEQGSWENGLSYECRSLLFKALHNLIERCLLSRDFVRLGKWFVQPQEATDPAFGSSSIPLKGSHLSFSISFFVHGESTVCASIDVRQHPTVRRITQRHLSAAQVSNGGVHVMLAPYGLSGTLTGQSYRVTDPFTRKLIDDWRQYYPIGADCGASQMQRGPGPGGGPATGDAGFGEGADMVEVIVGNMRMRYPSCYVLVCDADNALNSAAFNQLAALEGGMSLTPPASPPSTQVGVSRTNHSVSLQQPSPQLTVSGNATGPGLAAAAALAPQTVHSWRPEEAARLAEQAWQDTLLSPSGLAGRTPLETSGPPTPSANDKDLWDFIDPTVKSSCICAKSRRNKTGSSGSSSNGTSAAATNSGGSVKTAVTSASSSCSSTSLTSTTTPAPSTSSSSTSSSKRSVVPFHLRPTYSYPANRLQSHPRDGPHTAGTGTGDAALQDRTGRSGTSSVSSGSSTPAPTPNLPTYQRSQAALRGSAATTTTSSSATTTSATCSASTPTSTTGGGQASLGGSAHAGGNSNNNSVGPSYLPSPASVAPSPLPTPHSHQPASVPPNDSTLPLMSPHPPPSNDASSLIPSTPTAADQQHNDGGSSSKATPVGPAHTPGGPKSNMAYSPYVASVDTPGWPHSAGPAPPRSVQNAPGSAAPCVAPASTASAQTPSQPVELYGMRKPSLPFKEYEADLKEEQASPELLYDFSSMTAWLYHPVKRMRFEKEANGNAATGASGGDRSSTPQIDQNSISGGDGSSGTTSSGQMVNGVAMDVDSAESMDFIDDQGNRSRKRKEPDTKDDDNGVTSVNAASKAVNPSSLFTSEGLQASYQVPDNIFDNSDESNDTCPVPTPPGSNKPAGLPEDTALMSKPRTSHASPGSGTTLGTMALGGGGSGVNILATAELIKMFPTPPSHEQPMQSPCGHLEGTDPNGDVALSAQNGVKTEPGLNGGSPSYLSEDPNKDWSYVYRPPPLWKVPNSAKYAPLPLLPSQTLTALVLPPPYRPTFNESNSGSSGPGGNSGSAATDIPRPMMASIRPFNRIPMAPPPHFGRNVGPAPFSPISPSPFGSMDGGFGPHSHMGHMHPVRPGMGPMGFSPHMNQPSGTLKQLLQHQQAGMHQQPPHGPLGHPSMHHPQQQFHPHHPHHPPHPPHPNHPHHPHHGPHPPQGQQGLHTGQGPMHPPQPNLPECHSLMLNIVLGDSLLNVFRDHNFDGCAICVCVSDGQNCLGTIRGPDAMFYLPESTRPGGNRALPAPSTPSANQFGPMGGFLPPVSGQEDESCRCNCGFSAIVNRRLSHQAGLFYEDEAEIVGQASTQDPAQYKRGSLYAICHSEKEDHLVLTRSRLMDFAQIIGAERKQLKNGDKDDKNDMVSSTIAAVVMEATAPTVDAVPVALMEMLREQCLLLHHTSSPLYRAEQLQAASRKASSSILHALELSDSCEAARNALNLALYSSPVPLAPSLQQQPTHPHQPPPPYQQPSQPGSTPQPQTSPGPPHWSPHPAGSATPNPYMPFNPVMGGFQPGFNPHHPMSPSLHSPTMPIRGRPPTPAGAMAGAIVRPPLSSAPTGPTPPAPGPIVHYWPFLHVDGPSSSQDIVRVMRTLQPLLQESIQKKRAAPLWGAPFAVQGPLTWRQFHRMAVRGTEDRCEPQPIPAVIAGFDRDWVSIAPLAISHWDRLLLEPYSRPRDVAYIVVAPDVDYVLAKTKRFFRELSSTYEMCRLGRHVPITKTNLRDGIMRVGKSAAAKLANDPVDDWFTNIGDSPVATILRLYAKVCRHYLAPQLANLAMDKTLLDPPAPPGASKPSHQPVPSPMVPPGGAQSNPEFPNAMGSHNPQQGQPLQPPQQPGAAGNPVPGQTPDGKPTSPKTDQPGEEGAARAEGQPIGPTDASADDDESEPPAIVVYMLDPFSFASDSQDLGRLTTLGLLRCFHQMLATLSEAIQLNVSLQLVSLDSVMQLGRDFHGARHSDSLRSLALNVFSQCKKFVGHTSNVKSLTGFGPAAAGDLFLKSKDEKNRAPYRLYVPAYVLAPNKDQTICDLDPNSSANNGATANGTPSASSLTLPRADRFSVLYVSYCLSEDQRWLIAACTDERGELVDSCTIGIDIPNRTKRKRVSARRFGLQRLMEFILGVISTGIYPWRLVIGRLGRMGHGELKSWSTLLSRKSLVRASKHIADICNQCSLYPTYAPTIVSACLVSLEPDSQFRMMTDQVTPDERFGQQSANSNLSTPEDASCTHILVFPTSATTRSPQTTFHEENINGPDLGDDDLLSALNDDMGDGFDGMGGFDDIFSSWPETDPVNDGNDDLTADLTGGGGGGMGLGGGCGTSMSSGADMGAPSPGRRGGMRSNMNPESPSAGMGGSGRPGSPGRPEQEEVGTLLQQPLALGYYVSTAPTGDMPTWFWSSCPHLARACPAFLKCALHLHNHAVQPNSDDLLLQQQVNNSSKVHPLDSTVTTDVLRYVMEGYNALSWLSLDPRSRDRRSCLPIHIQLLVQLYHALAALV